MFGRSGDFYHKRTVLQSGDVSGSSDYGRLPVFAYVKGNGVKLGIARHRIYTSDRRFPKKVIPQLKVMWKMKPAKKNVPGWCADRDDIEVI